MKWLQWMTLGMAGILLGVVLHAAFGADYCNPATLPDYLQIAATFSIPFLYFLIVERWRASNEGASKVFEKEINAVVSSVQQVFDGIGLQSIGIGEAVPLYNAGWMTVSDAGLRLKTLAALARGNRQDALGSDIDGIHRFVHDFQKQIHDVLINLKTTHQITDEMYGNMLTTHTYMLYNYYVTLLHIHGHKLRKGYELKIPKGVEITATPIDPASHPDSMRGR